jgi:hypothetical protein
MENKELFATEKSASLGKICKWKTEGDEYDTVDDHNDIFFKIQISCLPKKYE